MLRGPCSSVPLSCPGGRLDHERTDFITMQRTWEWDSRGTVFARLVLALALPAPARLDVGALDAVGPAARAAYPAVSLEVSAPARDARDGDRSPGLRLIAILLFLAILAALRTVRLGRLRGRGAAPHALLRRGAAARRQVQGQRR